jgi:hypothetical protein
MCLQGRVIGLDTSTTYKSKLYKYIFLGSH